MPATTSPARSGFLGSQFGVFGPVLMAGFLVALWGLARGRAEPKRDLILAAFAVPPILIITVQGFISEANANWAADGLCLGDAAGGGCPAGDARRWALWASLAIDGLAMVVLWVVLVSPATGNALGVGNAFKREEGWRQLAWR